MAIKIRYTTTTYKCPKCGKILKTTEEGREFIVWLFFFMFFTLGIMPLMIPEDIDYIYMLSLIPAVLIGLGLIGVSKYFKKYTKAGKEVITCRKCKSQIAIDGFGTRHIVSHENLLNRVMPDLRLISAAQIQYTKYDQNNQEYSEQIDLKFTNKVNQKSLDVSVKVSGFVWLNTTVTVNGESFDYGQGSLSKKVINILASNVHDKSVKKSVPVLTSSFSKLSDFEQQKYLSKKFKFDFSDVKPNIFRKDENQYVLFPINQFNKLMNIKQLIVVDTNLGCRFFASESSALGSFMLCEWIFDENDNNTQHLNYGPAGTSIIDNKSNNIITGDEVIIEQIHTIVSMKVEPEYISTKNGGSWNTVQSETYKNVEEKVSELIKKTNTESDSSALKSDPYAEDLENKKDAFWYEMKAEEGDANAQYNLAHFYSNGRGVDQDFEKAVFWYEKAAKQNYAKAQNNLGSCYSVGQGVPQNHEKALYWYEKAAKQGMAEAQYNLGVYYYNGKGIEQDYKLAAYWHQKASDQGLAKAQNNLGTCYFKGHGVVKDLKQAINWFEKAANQGYADSQFNLGQVYNTEGSVIKDEKQAFKWYKCAAEQGNAEAQNLIGFFYNNGKGVQKDSSQGLYWFQKAAEQGHVNAQFNCGLCYIYGDGIAQDESQGIKWIKKAAKQGDINSIRLLAAAGIQIDN